MGQPSCWSKASFMGMVNIFSDKIHTALFHSVILWYTGGILQDNDIIINGSAD